MARRHSETALGTAVILILWGCSGPSPEQNPGADQAPASAVSTPESSTPESSTPESSTAPDIETAAPEGSDSDWQAVIENGQVRFVPAGEERDPAAGADEVGADEVGADEVGADEVEPDDPRRESIQQLLDTHAEALRRFDVDAYLATFVSDRELRERERRSFLGLRALPLRTVELELRELGDEPGGGDSALAGTAELRYLIDGLPDDNPFVHPLRLAFAGDSDTWRIRELHEEREHPLIWRYGAVSIYRSNHFFIVGSEKLRSGMPEVAGVLESAYADLLRQSFPLGRGYLVFLMADARSYGAIEPNASRSLGMARSRYAFDGGELTVHSRAFYINGEVFRARGRAGKDLRRTVLTHELVHLALAGITRPSTPKWLIEGTAVHFSNDISYEQNRDLVRRGLDRVQLAVMTARSLSRHRDVERTGNEYLFSGNVVRYLVERGGQDRFLSFYGSYRGDRGSEPLDAGSLAQIFASLAQGPNWEDTSRRLEAHYELGLPELEAAVKERLSLTAR